MAGFFDGMWGNANDQAMTALGANLLGVRRGQEGKAITGAMGAYNEARERDELRKTREMQQKMQAMQIAQMEQAAKDAADERAHWSKPENYMRQAVPEQFSAYSGGPGDSEGAGSTQEAGYVAPVAAGPLSAQEVARRMLASKNPMLAQKGFAAMQKEDHPPIIVGDGGTAIDRTGKVLYHNPKDPSAAKAAATSAGQKKYDDLVALGWPPGERTQKIAFGMIQVTPDGKVVDMAEHLALTPGEALPRPGPVAPGPPPNAPQIKTPPAGVTMSSPGMATPEQRAAFNGSGIRGYITPGEQGTAANYNPGDPPQLVPTGPAGAPKVGASAPGPAFTPPAAPNPYRAPPPVRGVTDPTRGQKETALLETHTQQLGEAVAKTNLSNYEPALKSIEKKIKDIDTAAGKGRTPKAEGDIPGAGQTGKFPEALLSQEGKDLRRDRTELKNVLIKDRSGAAVTDQELNRLMSELAEGTFNTDKDFRTAVSNVRRRIEAIKKETLSGFHPDVVANYQRRGGTKQQDATTPAGDNSAPSPRGDSASALVDRWTR